jgi:ABC-type multidrug transport system ATPase subunit
MTDPPPVLRAESFGRRFGERQVLKASTLWLYPKRITALLGRNGSGKSTLLRLITGRVRADYGVLHYSGGTYQAPRLPRLARAGLFYIPERGLLSPVLTLAQHCDLFCRRDWARDILDELDLQSRLDHYGNQLSPGERVRASFALALLRKPRCVLADEPFLGIAPLDVDRISSLMRQLRANGVALAVTGHETDALLALADDVVWLTAGTTHALGTPEAALRHTQFRREYLGV